jgi:hypothetical protein
MSTLLVSALNALHLPLEVHLRPELQVRRIENRTRWLEFAS